MSEAADNAAVLLASLALQGQTIERLPEHLRPANEAEAMAVQRSYLLHHDHYGWKVGQHPSGKGWAGAPLRGSLRQSPASLSAMDATGLQIEVEIALVLGQDLPQPASIKDVRHAIGSMHLAFELFRSSFSDQSSQDVPSVMADHFSNAGMVLGSGRMPVDSDDLSNLAVTLHCNDATPMQSPTGLSYDTLLESTRWLSGFATALGQPLRRHDVILTGARIGPVSVAEIGDYMAACSFGRVSLTVR